MKFLLDFFSLYELVVFGVSIFIGYKFQVIYGVILAILCLWVELKYYEAKILENYYLISEIEKDIKSKKDLLIDTMQRKIEYETKFYYQQIQREYEPKRKFLVDKLVIVTFTGLLVVSKV